MKVASFFAGIGGFDLGFERTKQMEVVWQCEISDFCRDILQQHWPNVPCAKDIREAANEKSPGQSIPDAAIWTGGFPCQDVSLARMGPRKGLKGKQSGLFYDFARLIEARLPNAVIIENVAGLLSSHGGRDFQIVVRTLAELGYGVGWRVFNSRYFGVPQSRQRVYIVACYRDPERAAKVLFESECSEGNSETDGSDGADAVSPFKKELGDPRKGPIVQGLAYCLYACSARHTGTDWSRTYVTYPDGRVRRLMPIECERIQGFPDGWTIPKMKIDDVDRLDSLRYHAIGNAVTVDVAEWLATRLLATQQVQISANKKPLPKRRALAS